MQRRPLRLPNRDPIAEALEVFKGEAASGALSHSDEAFGDLVVHVAGESPFLPAAGL
jgi:hypothetical protein